MDSTKFSLVILVFSLSVWSSQTEANGLRLGHVVEQIGGTASVPLTATSSSDLQGLVATLDWDGEMLLGRDLIPSPLLADADMVVTRIEDSFAAIGVIVDIDNEGAIAIPTSDDLLVAEILVDCRNQTGVADLNFVDGLYATVDGGIPLHNLIVVDAASIDVEAGLTLENGSVECQSRPNQFSLDESGTPESHNVARVLMENMSPVQGYVVSLCHNASSLELLEMTPGVAATAVGVEFVNSEVAANVGVFSAILDLAPPLDGQTISPGADQHIATYAYNCLTEEAGPQPLTFCDSVLGTKNNTLVIGGFSIPPDLLDGEIFCVPSDCPQENCNNGFDDDCDNLIDDDDPDCDISFFCGPRELDVENPSITATVGSTTDVCLFLQSIESDGDPTQLNHVQGLSMVIEFDCNLTAGEQFYITNTITETVGVDFVDLNVDNDPDDGDGCELIVAVLVDAMPPFDGSTFPPINLPQRIGCIEFTVDDNPELCQTCLPIEFKNNLNASGRIPISNVASVGNVSRSPVLQGTEICAVSRGVFYRGDCNFSGGPEGLALDISDAAYITRFLFFPPATTVDPPCLDACDCNDDGRIDLADTLCTLDYLFRGGGSPLPPGPGLEPIVPGEPLVPTPPGIDPTLDILDCVGGRSCP